MVIRDPTVGSGTGAIGAMQGAAASLGMEVLPIDARTASSIERGFTTLAGEPNIGLLVLPNGQAIIRRELIVKLAARYRVPAAYVQRDFVSDGGLMSYGPNEG